MQRPAIDIDDAVAAIVKLDEVVLINRAGLAAARVDLADNDVRVGNGLGVDESSQRE
jgi:hypothetical protein